MKMEFLEPPPHLFYTETVKYYKGGNSPVHNSKIKLCTRLFKNYHLLKLTKIIVVLFFPLE